MVARAQFATGAEASIDASRVKIAGGPDQAAGLTSPPKPAIRVFMDSDSAHRGSTSRGEGGGEEVQRDPAPSPESPEGSPDTPSSESSQVSPDTPSPDSSGASPDTPSPAPPQAAPDAPSPPERCNILLLSFVAFCLIWFGVWVVSAGKRYREEYAQLTEGWRVGTTRMVEVTLVKADKYRLACDASQDLWGLHCGGDRDLHKTGFEPNMLQPYNTVGNKLFLGAGLWNSPALQEPLPEGRFTVVCNYNIKGVAKSVRVRFAPTGSFVALGKTVTAGTLTECVIPK